MLPGCHSDFHYFFPDLNEKRGIQLITSSLALLTIGLLFLAPTLTIRAIKPILVLIIP